MNTHALIGSKISLISRAGIRYEGILCNIDAKNSTAALSQVRSFGTEDRNVLEPVPPRDTVYESIMFRGSDIQDIHVSEYPNRKTSIISQDSAILKVSPMSEEDAMEMPRRPSYGRGSSDHRRRSESMPRYINTNYGPTSHRPMQDVRYLPRMRGRNDEESQPYMMSRGRRYYNRRSPVVYYRGNSLKRDNGRGYTPRRRGDSESRKRNDSDNQKGSKNKYTSDYDFESENAKIADELEKLEVSKGRKKSKKPESLASDVNRQASGDKASDNVTNDSSGSESVCSDESEDLANLSNKDLPNPIEFYNQKKSFFDNISSEAKDRAKGKTIRSLNWREEKKLNSETFGIVNRTRRAPYFSGYSGYFYRVPNRNDFMRMYSGPPNNGGRNRGGYWRNSGYSYYDHRPMLVGWR